MFLRALTERGSKEPLFACQKNLAISVCIRAGMGGGRDLSPLLKYNGVHDNNTGCLGCMVCALHRIFPSAEHLVLKVLRLYL
jgi:hypothetical protein